MPNSFRANNSFLALDLMTPFDILFQPVYCMSNQTALKCASRRVNGYKLETVKKRKMPNPIVMGFPLERCTLLC